MITIIDLLNGDTSASDCINAVLDSNISEDMQLEMVIHLEWIKWSKQTWNKTMSQMSYEEFKKSEFNLYQKWLNKAKAERL